MSDLTASICAPRQILFAEVKSLADQLEASSLRRRSGCHQRRAEIGKGSHGCGACMQGAKQRLVSVLLVSAFDLLLKNTSTNAVKLHSSATTGDAPDALSTTRRQGLPRVPEASVSPRPGATSACSVFCGQGNTGMQTMDPANLVESH